MLLVYGCDGVALIATAKKTEPGCSGHPAVLDQQSGQFSSPDFGGGRQYAGDLSCSWLIMTQPGTVSLNVRVSHAVDLLL